MKSIFLVLTLFISLSAIAKDFCEISVYEKTTYSDVRKVLKKLGSVPVYVNKGIASSYFGTIDHNDKNKKIVVGGVIMPTGSKTSLMFQQVDMYTLKKIYSSKLETRDLEVSSATPIFFDEFIATLSCFDF